MKHLTLKMAIVGAGLRNQDVANQANVLLRDDQHLSELDVSKILTGRKYPRPEQQEALAAVLDRTVAELFPDQRSNP